MPDTTHVDVLVIGAGMAGIGVACHLRRRHPDRSIALLEQREAIGGTWDLFRYPGIRSDSDLQTFSYAFKPWTHRKSIASADTTKARFSRAFGVPNMPVALDRADQFLLLSTSWLAAIQGIMERSLVPTCSMGCSALRRRRACIDG